MTEFSSNQIRDQDHILCGAIASCSGLGGLDHGVDRFDGAVAQF